MLKLFNKLHDRVHLEAHVSRISTLVSYGQYRLIEYRNNTIARSSQNLVTAKGTFSQIGLPHLPRYFPSTTATPASSPTHQLTNSPTHQLTNSPTHQLTNSPTHQLTNSPTHQTINNNQPTTGQ